MRVRRGGRGAGGVRGEERGWGGAVWLGLGRRGAQASHGGPVGSLGGPQVRRAWGLPQDCEGRPGGPCGAQTQVSAARGPRAHCPRAAPLSAPCRPGSAGPGRGGLGPGRTRVPLFVAPTRSPPPPPTWRWWGPCPCPATASRALCSAPYGGAGAAALRNRAGEGRGGTPAAGHPGDALPGGLRAGARVTLGLPPRQRLGEARRVAGTAQRWGSRSLVASCTAGTFWAFPGGGGVGLRNGFSLPRRCLRITKFVYAIVFILIWFL